LRRREVSRLSERILLLDGVATRLAERVIERQRELEAVRAELTERVERAERQLDGGSGPAGAGRSEHASPEITASGPKPATRANGGKRPVRQAGRPSDLPVR
jgi:hypothetical protein